MQKVRAHLESEAAQCYFRKVEQVFKTKVNNIKPKAYTQDSFDQGLMPFHEFVQGKAGKENNGWYCGTLHFGIELHRII